jgi:hypothetical protein
MSQVKVLNLDTLPTSAPQRVVTIGGVEYPVKEMDVEGFIETNLAADRLKDQTDPKVQIEEMIASIKRAVEIPDAVLNKLPLEKLGVLVAFLRGLFDPDKKDVEGAAGTEGDAEKK